MAEDSYAQSKAFDALNARGLAGKRDYVRGLEGRADDEALSLLVECLCDESWYLRDLAEAAILRMGERAAPALLPLLGQGLWYTRTSAARVLGTFGRREAVTPLLGLTDDANETVAAAARDALVQIGRGGGSIVLARCFHGLPADLRRRRLDDVAVRDRQLVERLERLMRNEDLMSPEHGDALDDDSPLVRASEEGLEWEVLTGPPKSAPASPRPEPGDGERSTP